MRYGNYAITAKRTDGTAEKWNETSKNQAIATARTYSLLGSYAYVEVHWKMDGSLVGRYEANKAVAGKMARAS